MSSNRIRNFSRIESPPYAQNPMTGDRGTTYQNTYQPRLSPQVGDPQPPYTDLHVGGLDDHRQTYQRRKSNEAELGLYTTAIPTAPTSVSPQTLKQYRAYERGQYTAASYTPPIAAQHDSQTFQYRSSPGIIVPQVYSPQPAVAQKGDILQTSTPIQRKALPYQSPPSQGQEYQYPSSAAHELSTQHSSGPFQRNVSPYSPAPANAIVTPDTSTIGSPLPRMSPNSLQRELEKANDYSENILTKLIETQRLLEEREAEIARLHDCLATSGGGRLQQHGGAPSNSWEHESLRRKLHEQGQALRAALDDAGRAHSLAQYQQDQAERYSQEYFRLKESQSRIQQQPQVNPAQMEEARNVTEFYKQKVDQLSRENMSITQQNRKLTEDLAAAQRKVQQQKSLVDSMR